MTRAEARRAREGYCLMVGETHRQAIVRRVRVRLLMARYCAKINAR